MSGLQVIEHDNERILLTSQIAEGYGTDPRIISNNYNRNKERYVPGKHFYCLEGDAKREFIDHHQIDDGSKNATTLYLWTERGALLHAKSLGTDEAWAKYEELSETYFKVREMTASLNALSPQLQVLIGIEIEQKRLSAKIDATDRRVDNIREIVALNSIQWRKDASRIITKIADQLGGNDHIRDARDESYKLLEARFGVSLKTRLANKRRRMADEGVCKSKRDKLNQLDVIAEDKKLIEGYVAIVKELAIKYGVAA